MIPYGRQFIDEDDIEAVVQTLKSNWLTTGPKVSEFEEAVADYVGAGHAVAVSSGTAALHCTMFALGIEQGDEVIVPSMTFAASANCVTYQDGKPVFADVDSETLLINHSSIEEKINGGTRAIIAVDYAGHPCDYDGLREISDESNLKLVADGCHALGAEYKGRRVGSLADMTVFSFHPVKHIATGEGGMIVTDNSEYAERMRLFRNHGINSDFRQREQQGSWHYEMVDLGYNYRLTDIQSALGISQLRKLPGFLEIRRKIAAQYDEYFARVSVVEPLKVNDNVQHAYHLYVVKIDFTSLKINRTELFKTMREKGVGVNVHYIPVHLHPYYRKTCSTSKGMCPVAEKVYEQILSLPIHPEVSQKDVDKVVSVLLESIK